MLWIREDIAGNTAKNYSVILSVQLVQVDLCESIEETLGESLSARSRRGRLAGVLTGEDEEVRMCDELLVELRDVNSPSVVQYGIQAFENTLLSQVHFINKKPVAFFNG